ncbi:translation initiation factor IF-2-like [Tachysurus ichikawai]
MVRFITTPAQQFHQGTLDRAVHNKDTGQLKHNRRSSNHTSNNKQSKDNPNRAKFNEFVEKFFELLRSHHHLEKVLVDNDKGPPTFTWLTRYLGEVVRPAKITPETKALLEGNAKNWAYTNKLILQDHYAQVIDREVDELQGLMVTDWAPAFARAEKRYQNKYRKRHESKAIEKVKAILTALGDKPVQVLTPKQVPTSEQALATIEVNQQEEQMSDDTEFPPLTHNWFSPPPSNPTTPPQPTLLTATTPRIPSPRSPRAPRRDQVTINEPSIRKQNPAVISGKDMPELSEINTHTGTQEVNHTTISTRTHKPQQIPGKVWSQVVIVNPEIPNPELNEATIQGPQLTGGEMTITEVAQTSTPEKVTTESQGTEEREVLIDVPPPDDSLLCASQQDLHNSLLMMPQLTPMRTPGSPGTFRPTRHLITQRKMVDWSLNVRKKWCIVGDSNLSRIPAHNNKDLQIDSYPGATFRHAEAFISKANMQTTVEVIMLAFGINHRVQKRKETGVKELQRAVKATKEKFPHASIWIPLINYSKTLPIEEQIILRELNAHIKRNMPFLPALPGTKFQVGKDQIHWTPACAQAMLQHWSDHLNF